MHWKVFLHLFCSQHQRVQIRNWLKIRLGWSEMFSPSWKLNVEIVIFVLSSFISWPWAPVSRQQSYEEHQRRRFPDQTQLHLVSSDPDDPPVIWGHRTGYEKSILQYHHTHTDPPTSSIIQSVCQKLKSHRLRRKNGVSNWGTDSLTIRRSPGVRWMLSPGSWLVESVVGDSWLVGSDLKTVRISLLLLTPGHHCSWCLIRRLMVWRIVEIVSAMTHDDDYHCCVSLSLIGSCWC